MPRGVRYLARSLRVPRCRLGPGALELELAVTERFTAPSGTSSTFPSQAVAAIGMPTGGTQANDSTPPPAEPASKRQRLLEREPSEPEERRLDETLEAMAGRVRAAFETGAIYSPDLLNATTVEWCIRSFTVHAETAAWSQGPELSGRRARCHTSETAPPFFPSPPQGDREAGSEGGRRKGGWERGKRRGLSEDGENEQEREGSGGGGSRWVEGAAGGEGESGGGEAGMVLVGR